MNGRLYANEILKLSRLAYGNVTKLVDVEFLVSVIATSLQIVMQSEIIGRCHATNTFKYGECNKIISSCDYINPF